MGSYAYSDFPSPPGRPPYSSSCAVDQTWCAAGDSFYCAEHGSICPDYSRAGGVVCPAGTEANDSNNSCCTSRLEGGCYRAQPADYSLAVWPAPDCVAPTPADSRVGLPPTLTRCSSDVACSSDRKCELGVFSDGGYACCRQDLPAPTSGCPAQLVACGDGCMPPGATCCGPMRPDAGPHRSFCQNGYACSEVGDSGFFTCCPGPIDAGSRGVAGGGGCSVGQGNEERNVLFAGGLSALSFAYLYRRRRKQGQRG